MSWLILMDAPAHDGLPFGDQKGIPPAAILIPKQDEIAVRSHASDPTRLEKQHEREQPQDLRFIGQELRQQSSEPDRFRAEVVTHKPFAGGRRIALVENEVHNCQDGPQSRRKVGLTRNSVWNPRVANFALGSDQSLRHRRFGHQEGARDLCGREASKQSQR
jgi:hypothetical protein